MAEVEVLVEAPTTWRERMQPRSGDGGDSDLVRADLSGEVGLEGDDDYADQALAEVSPLWLDDVGEEQASDFADGGTLLLI